MGRPSVYTPELLEKAKAYLNKSKGERYFPSVAELSLVLDIARSSVYKIAQEHEEFSDILEKILAEQERKLIENGLLGEYNPQITKLVLGKHGYTDKQDLTTAGKELPQPLLNVLHNNVSDEEAS